MDQDKKLVLKGIAASSGQAQGKVKKVKGAKDCNLFNEGEILVTRFTDPTMIIIMGKAAAIICDIGGITSHSAIVSREMGIPCVVNTKEGTSVLKDGDIVLVDGEKGEVHVL